MMILQLILCLIFRKENLYLHSRHSKEKTAGEECRKSAISSLSLFVNLNRSHIDSSGMFPLDFIGLSRRSADRGSVFCRNLLGLIVSCLPRL